MKIRILACALLLVLCLCQMPVSALTVAVGKEIPLETETETETEFGPTETIQEPGMGYATVTLADSAVTVADMDLKTAILQGLYAMEERIDISQFKVTPEQLHAVVQDLLFGSAWVFHVDSGYSYSYGSSYVYAFVPTYIMNKTAYKNARDFCEEQLEKIVEHSGALAAKDDLTKALLLHDYIAGHFEYDTQYEIYDMYRMLKNGKAVCQGYTLLYGELLSRVGMESGYAHSSQMNHIWNLVLIDGEYYHVDVTWADPISDRYSLVNHTYFMLSDAYIQNNPLGQNHYGWTASDGIVCDSTVYDQNIFTSAHSPFVLCGSDLYYINYSQGTLCRYTGPYTKGEVMCDVSDYWLAKEQDGSYYPGTYSGLVAIGANLYFNSADTVGMYNVITKKSRTILEYGTDNNQIVGMRMDEDNTLCYALAPDPYTEVISYMKYEIPPLHDSDVTGDGILNVEDLSCILCYLAGVDENPLCRPDVNGDGILNVSDLNTVLIALATAE